MVEITFPPTTAPGVKPAESGGRLINAYAENLPGLPKSPYVLRRSAGITQFSDTLRSGFRGSFFDANQYFSAWSGRLVWTNSLGVTADVGGLAGTEWVSFARNNKIPTPDYLVCTSFGLFSFTAAGVGAGVGPIGVLGNSVCFGDGFFFLTVSTGDVYASAVNDGLGLGAPQWNTLNRMSANSAHDPIIGGKFFNGELYVFGSSSIEVWGAGGNPNPSGFPLRRTTVIWRGAVALSCITGWEDNFGGSLAWVADDNTVRLLNGYTPQIISTPVLHRLIEGVADKTTMSMGCYVLGGRQCIYLRAPHFFWSYEVGANAWHERRSWLSDTCRFMGGSSFGFGVWTSADPNSGKLGFLDESTAREWGDPLVYAIESQPSQQYPARLQVSRANFTMQQGTGALLGDDSDVNPEIEISWSDDDGNSWVPPLRRPIGALGAYRTMVDATQLGMTGYVGRRWRLACAANVYVGVFSGTADLYLRK